MPYSLRFLHNGIPPKVEQGDNQSWVHTCTPARFPPHTDLSLYPCATATEATHPIKLTP
ncbi:MAG TPA: hypothetical protein VK857_00930 [Desulforhopalus sp.]|jgi:hypothetical protein|nr:hypothetical protein [Desulforhopalus sp.]